MVSFDTIATIALILLLGLLVIRNRRKLTFHRGLGIFFVAMYRTQAGLKTMDRIAKKWYGLWLWLAPVMIVIGYIGMAVVTFDLTRGLINLLSGAATPSVGVVLPIQAKGVFYVPFTYWILSIFIILIVHEGAHGVMARVFGLPVKNSGLLVAGALIPLIPGAFVEPDEKKLVKAKPKEQLAVYAAGPFANIALAAIILLISTFFLTPLTDNFYAKDGVVISELMDGNSPAQQAGLIPGEKITHIDGSQITEPAAFSAVFVGKEPGDSINLITSKSVYDITLGENPDNAKPWLGVFVERELAQSNVLVHSLLWLKEFFFWLFLLNLGVGLFNLVPLGPIDGGRMLLTGLSVLTHEKRAAGIWKTVSFGVLSILVINLVVVFL